MKNVLVYKKPKSEIVKRYIDLKDSLVSLSSDDVVSVMITSPKEESKQSDLVANLAIIMGKNGYKTLIIDCNIENSNIDKMFEINNELGISDYVLNRADLKDVVKNTELDKLKVITTGEKNIDIIGNEKIENLIKEVKKQYDYIIINAPAVLNGNGAQVLAKYCDGMILSVEHEITKIEDIKKSQLKLEKFQNKIIGCVLNNFNKY